MFRFDVSYVELVIWGLLRLRWSKIFPMRKTQDIFMQIMTGVSSVATLILCVGAFVVFLWVVVAIVRLIFQAVS